MKKMKIGILLVFAVLALVSVASAALPSYPVDVTIPNSNAAISYLKADVTSSGAPELPTGAYNAWCVDSTDSIKLKTSYAFTAYSSLDEASIAASGMPSAQWKKINYILNNPNADWKITQAAMWHYDGDSALAFPTHDIVTGYNHAAYTAYINQVNLNGNGFVPSNGQLYAVVLYKKGTQVVIIPRPTSSNAPEFPTLALPVAMIIGVVGAVQFVRARKE